MSGFLGMFAASGGISTPIAPTIGTATAISTSSATVTFTAGYDGGSPILDYTVTSSPGGITATGSSSPITVTGLTSSTTYTFTVVARNLIGTGLSSASSNSARIWSVPDAPTSVSAVVGSPGTLQATVSFSAPSWGGGDSITQYTVRSSGGHTVTGSSSPITVTGLNGNTDYTFTVSATNSVGEGAQSSSSNSVRPLFAPISAGGGSVYDGTGSFAGYRFHVFNSPGEFSVSSNQAGHSFDILLVGAGGGNAGQGPGAGAGGGQIITSYGIGIPTTESRVVTVGQGAVFRPSSADNSRVNRPSPVGSQLVAGSSYTGWDGGGGTQGGWSGSQFRNQGAHAGGLPGADNSPFNQYNRWGGGGGGGAGSDGNGGNKASSPPAQDPRPSPDPGAGGPGGNGEYSPFDGNTYSGGGGGGASNRVWPAPGGVAAEGGAPGGIGGSGGGGPGAPTGGGASPGSYYGGGGGGRSNGPLGGASPSAGYPGVVVIRYPYP